MTDDSGRTVAGKYKIVRALGRGGMGEVYLALDTRLERSVAVKYLRGDLPEGDWQSRMQREAQLLAQLNHPNIVQIYDILDLDGVPALVMEYVDGRNLHIHLREHRVDLGERLRWLAEISSGIAASHEQGIVHCDLKPENVLLSPAGVAKVTDFGIASDASDPAADIQAMGRLAETILSDYRNALSPTLRDLLADLTREDPQRRPDARQAAERFRLCWYENSQVETPLPGEFASAPASGKRRWPVVVAVGLFTALVVIATLWLSIAPPPHYVAVAPVTVTTPTDSDQRKARYLKTAVAQALRQNVVESPGLALVSYQQQELAGVAPREVLEALGVDSLLVGRLDCSGATCEFSLERLESPDARVAGQRNTTLLLDSVLDADHFLRGQWPSLFPEAGESSLGELDISEADYKEYLTLFQALEQASLPHGDIMRRLEELQGRAPAFVPLYTLYAEAAIVNFEYMGGEQDLQRAEQILREGARQVSDPALLDEAWFDLYIVRGDTQSAGRVLGDLVASSNDPARAAFLQAELHRTAMEFDLADTQYRRAVTLQPSSEHYYNLAKNAYFAGRTQEAAKTLEDMLERYPFSLAAWNLKGIIHSERWELEQAVKAFSTAAEIQPDPLTRVNLGGMYMFQQDYARAKQQFELAYQLDSRDSVLVLNLADAESLLGNRDRAEALYTSLVDRANSGDVSVLPEVAAQAHAQLGQFEQALTIVREYETEWENKPFYAFSTALVYTLAGQEIAALVEVSKALQGGLDARYFNLPWFDALCRQPRFAQVVSEGNTTERCPPGMD